ncbi:hypothetical protein PoB_000561000 [Plakobranchus ocellatus]|uniref:Uncharacterized protein n=1 Tax=Plakobranchus ocellatus TaxID=259542 RepID=A0AAV3Y9C6_9GAST|nr:hypothetical protein PoB_000561000 [Plakobranchus ocellatus]
MFLLCDKEFIYETYRSNGTSFGGKVACELALTCPRNPSVVSSNPTTDAQARWRLESLRSPCYGRTLCTKTTPWPVYGYVPQEKAEQQPV